MSANRVARTVLIQVIHYRWDNRYLLDVLHRYPGKFHGVCRVNPEDPAAPDHLSKLTEAGCHGVRLSPGASAQSDWFRGPLMAPLWKRCAELKVPMTLLLPASRLPDAAVWIEKNPGLDVVIAPLGGGGLLSGTAVATRGTRPEARVFGAEPAAGDDGKQSFDAGEIVTIPVPETLADGAQTTALGRLTFPIIRELVEDIVRVTDDELVAGMRVLAQTCKLVVEPTGALAFAAAVSLAPSMPGARVGVILSGGNVDLDRYARLIASH